MRGILFKPDMIKAIIENRKTQTRRLVPQFTLPLEAGAPYLSNGFLSVIPDRINFKGWAWITDKKGHKIKPRYRVGEVVKKAILDMKDDGIVYIKEAWATEKQYDHLKPRDIPGTAKIFYLLDGYDPQIMGKKRSPLFLPEIFARCFIKIIDIGVGRLQNITEEDAQAEGVTRPPNYSLIPHYIEWFKYWWDKINPRYPWVSNPWCWKYTFEKVDR